MNIEKYTQNAQGAIIDCQNIAVEEGHQQIDGEHLHLALLCLLYTSDAADD